MEYKGNTFAESRARLSTELVMVFVRVAPSRSQAAAAANAVGPTTLPQRVDILIQRVNSEETLQGLLPEDINDAPSLIPLRNATAVLTTLKWLVESAIIISIPCPFC